MDETRGAWMLRLLGQEPPECNPNDTQRRKSSPSKDASFESLSSFNDVELDLLYGPSKAEQWAMMARSNTKAEDQSSTIGELHDSSDVGDTSICKFEKDSNKMVMDIEKANEEENPDSNVSFSRPVDSLASDTSNFDSNVSRSNPTKDSHRMIKDKEEANEGGNPDPNVSSSRHVDLLASDTSNFDSNVSCSNPTTGSHRMIKDKEEANEGGNPDPNVSSSRPVGSLASNRLNFDNNVSVSNRKKLTNTKALNEQLESESGNSELRALDLHATDSSESESDIPLSSFKKLSSAKAVKKQEKAKENDFDSSFSDDSPLSTLKRLSKTKTDQGKQRKKSLPFCNLLKRGKKKDVASTGKGKDNERPNYFKKKNCLTSSSLAKDVEPRKTTCPKPNENVQAILTEPCIQTGSKNRSDNQILRTPTSQSAKVPPPVAVSTPGFDGDIPMDLTVPSSIHELDFDNNFMMESESDKDMDTPHHLDVPANISEPSSPAMQPDCFVTPIIRPHKRKSITSSDALSKKSCRVSLNDNFIGTENYLALPLESSTSTKLQLEKSDLVASPSTSSPEPTSSRYTFRKRLQKPLLTQSVLSEESDSESGDFSGSDGSDTEWALTHPLLHSKQTAIRTADIEESESELESDNNSVDGGIITVSKTSKAWLKKNDAAEQRRSPTENEENLDIGEEDMLTNNDSIWIDNNLVETVRPTPQFKVPAEKLEDPLEYFKFFFDEDIIDLMTEMTNIYSTYVSNGTKCLNITYDDMNKFLGLWMYMGVTKLPALRDYWSAETRDPNVAELMSFNKFQSIRSALHFYDKSQENLLDSTDRYCKVSALLNHIRKKCNSLEQENIFCVDETMVPYKGTFAGNLRQFIRNKPHRFGIKIFNLAGVSGIVYDFLVYAGKSTFDGANLSPEEMEMGLGSKVVLHLSKSIDRPQEASMYFDNFFNSVKLISHLKDKYNILSTGTLRADRLDKCPLLTEKELKKKGRGSYDSKMNQNGVQVVKWFDNKAVHIGSSIAGCEPMGKAKRYDKVAGQRVEVAIPRCIELYNENMGGVDLSDMLVELNRTPTRARRWYICLIGYMMDLALTNSWLLYRRHAKSLQDQSAAQESCESDDETQEKGLRANLPKKLLTSKEFRLAVSKGLRGLNDPSFRSKQNVKKPRGYNPPPESTQDGYKHYPIFQKVQGRCKQCKKHTTIFCMKCSIYLCFVPSRNCFVNFHNCD